MMPDSTIDKELEAIKTITKALGSLEAASQQRAIQYAMEHLGLDIGHRRSSSESHQSPLTKLPPVEPVQDSNDVLRQRVIDIRSLKEQKQPQSDVQMAVVATYYITELAPTALRKPEISAADVTELFKQADYPLPKRPEFTLPNAKQAGYLDSAGHGKYKLNPVGHNLVAHNLPKTGSDVIAPTRRRKKASSKKKTSKKKTSKKGRSKKR